MTKACLPRAVLLLATLAAWAAPSRAAAEAGPGADAGWRDATQLVLVLTGGWDDVQARLQAFERDGPGWRAAGASSAASIGANGAAWGMGLHPAQADGPQKHEGDGRSPAGVFRLGEAFGYAGSADTLMPYLPMSASHYCIDVPSSPLYNRIVDARQAGEAAISGSTEPMRRDLHLGGDQRYRQGLVIDHNPANVAGAGSCIFAHLWLEPGEGTAGCTAMDDATMQRLLAWLRPERKPVLVLLPRNEYERLKLDWNLPEMSP